MKQIVLITMAMMLIGLWGLHENFKINSALHKSPNQQVQQEVIPMENSLDTLEEMQEKVTRY